MKRYWERWKIFLSARSSTAIREKALHYIWEQYRRPLGWYIRSLDHRTSVDDTIQEVLLRVWERMEDYDPAWAFSTWIYTITRNLVRKSPRLEWQPLDENIPDEKPDTADMVQLRDDLARTRRYLDSLEETDARIAFFRFYEGLSYQDIAAILEMPPGTVKYRVHAIRKGLKKSMGGHDEKG